MEVLKGACKPLVESPGAEAGAVIDLPASNQPLEITSVPVLSSRERSNLNLKPFQPGHSGNPAGKKPGKAITTCLAVEAQSVLTEEDCAELKLPAKFVGLTRAQAGAKVIFNLALQGDHLALDRIADRLEGRPMSALELRGSEEAPVRIHAHVSDANLALLEKIAEETEAVANASAGIIEGSDIRDVSEPDPPSR